MLTAIDAMMNRMTEPTFRGLFMGVDSYASSAVSELRYAEADATALHALFSDTLGGEAELLVGRRATRAAIESSMRSLAGCSSEDVVVVSFSGHGSETHELVTYDADVDDLAGSCIPLELLTEWFAAIPARQLICVLDCCFSGGMGAKVLRSEATARSLRSEEIELTAMAGEGRLILTASTAQEPAWEMARLRHGLLTHYLLEALQGVEEVQEGQKLPVLRLLEHVTRRVIDAAASMGRNQRPTLRGSLEGELAWPVFVPGRRFLDAFPELGRAQATAEIGSLAAFGFPGKMLDAWSAEIPSLNALQLDAVNEYGLLGGEHLLVSAPTSSGKTLIGELAALQDVLRGGRALFLLPLKALVNDKHQEFERRYGALGVRTIRSTGDFTDDNAVLMRGQYDICLTTYEKATALVLAAPHLLEGVTTVVVDEVQTLTDASRGANLEFLLTLLRVRREVGVEPQTVALSAVIGDTGGLERWFGGRLLRREERPVPLDEGVLTGAGDFRFRPTDAARSSPAEAGSRSLLRYSARVLVVTGSFLSSNVSWMMADR